MFSKLETIEIQYMKLMNQGNSIKHSVFEAPEGLYIFIQNSFIKTGTPNHFFEKVKFQFSNYVTMYRNARASRETVN